MKEIIEVLKGLLERDVQDDFLTWDEYNAIDLAIAELEGR